MIELQELAKLPDGTAVAIGIPAPTGGINARDPLDAMPPTDALRLDNMFCTTADVAVRPGYASHGTGVGSGNVESLVAFDTESAKKLVAFGGGGIYNASAAGAAVSLATGFRGNRWETTPHNNYLVCANGADDARIIDSALTVSTPTFTGVDLDTLTSPATFKGRLFFAANNSASFWYGGVGEVTGGTLTEFDLGQIAQRGGYLESIGTWSPTTGDGLQDLICFVMSTGEIVVYSGSNPGDATDWAKQGTYVTAPPLGKRCLIPIGGELLVLTRAGYFPMSLIIQGATSDQLQGTQYGKIRDLIRREVDLYSGNFGWQGVAALEKNRLIVNIPVVTNGEYRQHVLNTLTGAWTTWGASVGSSRIDARCWAIYDGAIYFGGAGGVVYKQEGLDDAGTAIAYDCKQAFTYAGDRGHKKLLTSARPVIQLDGAASIKFDVDVDYANKVVTNTATVTAPSGGVLWGTADWGAPLWGGGAAASVDFITIGVTGRNMAPRLSGTVSGQNLAWVSTDIVGQIAGVI